MQIATKVNCEKCKILTEIISVVTVQCEKCKNVFQIPVQSKSFFRVKKDDNQS
jgi:hypothetical protein